MPFAQSGSSDPNYWSRDIGPMHVVSLNSYASSKPGSYQYKWLSQDLKSFDRQKTPWLLVIMHAPWYNSNLGHYGEAKACCFILESVILQPKNLGIREPCLAWFTTFKHLLETLQENIRTTVTFFVCGVCLEACSNPDSWWWNIWKRCSSSMAWIWSWLDMCILSSARGRSTRIKPMHAVPPTSILVMVGTVKDLMHIGCPLKMRRKLGLHLDRVPLVLVTWRLWTTPMRFLPGSAMPALTTVKLSSMLPIVRALEIIPRILCRLMMCRGL